MKISENAPPFCNWLQCHTIHKALTYNLYRLDLVDCNPSHQVSSTTADLDQPIMDYHFANIVVLHIMPPNHICSIKASSLHSNVHFSSLYSLFSHNFATLGHLYGNNLFCMSPFLNFSLSFRFHYIELCKSHAPQPFTTESKHKLSEREKKKTWF